MTLQGYFLPPSDGLEQAPGDVGFDDPGIGFPGGFGPPG
jgi:hypothetical protein